MQILIALVATFVVLVGWWIAYKFGYRDGEEIGYALGHTESKLETLQTLTAIKESLMNKKDQKNGQD